MFVRGAGITAANARFFDMPTSIVLGIDAARRCDFRSHGG